ncbi:unnamed protein product [Closterium sp. NIES-53]
MRLYFITMATFGHTGKRSSVILSVTRAFDEIADPFLPRAPFKSTTSSSLLSASWPSHLPLCPLCSLFSSSPCPPPYPLLPPPFPHPPPPLAAPPPSQPFLSANQPPPCRSAERASPWLVYATSSHSSISSAHAPPPPPPPPSRSPQSPPHSCRTSPPARSSRGPHSHTNTCYRTPLAHSSPSPSPGASQGWDASSS